MSAALTWEAIEALRNAPTYAPAPIGRFLARPITGGTVIALMPKSRKVKAPTLADLLGGENDPRLPTNAKPHTSTPAPKRDKWTAAAAAKQRKISYAACGCRLCALALFPPMTFADAERFAYARHTGAWGQVRAEIDARAAAANSPTGKEAKAA